ncbi:MAG: hypothetical protein N2688_03000 [Burkholderiaceae bacterium]|nr:hypothetical protein [Burkholderiaceae bacterium]
MAGDLQRINMQPGLWYVEVDILWASGMRWLITDGKPPQLTALPKDKPAPKRTREQMRTAAQCIRAEEIPTVAEVDKMAREWLYLEDEPEPQGKWGDELQEVRLLEAATPKGVRFAYRMKARMEASPLGVLFLGAGAARGGMMERSGTCRGVFAGDKVTLNCDGTARFDSDPQGSGPEKTEVRMVRVGAC